MAEPNTDYVPADGTLRRNYGPDDEGLTVEGKLTHEGVIVDVFDADGECVGTFGKTWVELIEWIAPEQIDSSGADRG